MLAADSDLLLPCRGSSSGGWKKDCDCGGPSHGCYAAMDDLIAAVAVEPYDGYAAVDVAVAEKDELEAVED